MLPILASVALLALNAYFVLAEFALVKVRPTRLDELALKGDKSAELARYITQHLDAYLSTIQLGITMASLGIGWMAEPALASRLEPLFHDLPVALSATVRHSIAFSIAFTFITGAHVVLGELAPKSLAIRSPEFHACWSARPLYVFHTLFYLPMSALNWMSNMILKVFRIGGGGHEAAHSIDEVRLILSQSQEQGQLSLSRLMLFENLFEFEAAKLKDVMVARESVIFLRADLPLKENLQTIEKNRHSRYPVCKGDLDHATGYIHTKDLGKQILSSDPKRLDLNVFTRDILDFPAASALDKVLREMKRTRCHITLVRSPKGKVVGIATLEDILEELVGEIQDEFETQPVTTLASVFLSSGSVLDLKNQPKKQLLEKMLKQVHAAYPEFEYKRAWEILWKRETSVSSAVGHGLAFPHGRVPGLKRAVVVLGRCPEGVPFGAPDGHPVKLMFMILTPQSDPGAQLRILAKLATLMSNATFKRRLLKLKKIEEVEEIIRTFDQTMPIDPPAAAPPAGI